MPTRRHHRRHVTLDTKLRLLGALGRLVAALIDWAAGSPS